MVPYEVCSVFLAFWRRLSSLCAASVDDSSSLVNISVGRELSRATPGRLTASQTAHLQGMIPLLNTHPSSSIRLAQSEVFPFPDEDKDEVRHRLGLPRSPPETSTRGAWECIVGFSSHTPEGFDGRGGAADVGAAGAVGRSDVVWLVVAL